MDKPGGVAFDRGHARFNGPGEGGVSCGKWIGNLSNNELKDVSSLG